jgi:hypothetical protein
LGVLILNRVKLSGSFTSAKKSDLVDWVGRAQDLANFICPSDQNPGFAAILKLIPVEFDEARWK